MQEKYVYRNLPIPGGGYVTGFCFHPKKEGVLYIRTDIGGVYRFDVCNQRWRSLVDHVTMEDISETFPTAIALDENNPDKLYIACGINSKPHGRMAVSEDGGQSFVYYEMPMHVHGNLNGRGTGYRLIVDRKDDRVLWFASQDSGLWRSNDGGAGFERVHAFKEDYLTFVGQTRDGSALIVGCAGVTTKRTDRLRGHSLYVSYDDGATFSKLWQPEDGELDGVRLAGLVAQRYTMDEKYLYVTYAVMGRNAYVLELGYSCDGGSVIGGRVVRYPLLKDGTIGEGEDITPIVNCGIAEQMNAVWADASPGQMPADNSSFLLEYGFSGIDVCTAIPGLVIVSTISKEDGDCIYRSCDYGATWECILCDLHIGRMAFRTEYMTPKYNGGHNLIHWLSDLKINPFHPEEAWFNTGTGVFRSKNLLDEEVIFEDFSDGIEETVHLNLYSPPDGEVKLIDILGDLGGFAFTKLNEPCDNSFADENGNRYITCINADYSDSDSNYVVVTPRGNWTGKTKGGLIISTDQCKSFRRPDLPYGISDDLDEAFRQIETPNVNSGWVAVSNDCRHIVWSVARWNELPINRVIVSHDGGESFVQAKVYELDGKQKTEGGFKVFSDRTQSRLFYGFGDHSDFYVSKDYGETYHQVLMPTEFPEIDFTLIDCANRTEVRGESGKQGVFYLVAEEKGLWKLHYDDAADRVTLRKLSREGDVFFRMGLGVIRPGGSYFEENKAIYVSAIIDGEYGFYRSTDDGESFVRINEAHQMFGEINSMEGDSREYGRFYIATGSRGVLYGEVAECI